MTKSEERVGPRAVVATEGEPDRLPRVLGAMGGRGYLRGYGADAWRYVGYSFGTGLAFGFLQVLLGLYLLSVGYRESFLATQQLVVAVCSAGFSVLAGVVVDRVGAKRPVLLSGLLTALGLSLLVAGASAPLVLAASAVLGAGVAFYWVTQGPVLAGVGGRGDSSGLFGLNWTLFTASGFVGGLIAGYLPGALSGMLGLEQGGPAAYRYTVWLSALLLALFTVPLLWLRVGRREARREAQPGGWWRVEEPRKVAALLIPVAASAAAIGFTVPFLSVFLKGVHSASDERIGLILGLFALVGSLGGLLGPALRGRYGPVRAVSVLLLLSAPVMLLTGFAPGLGVATAALWMRGLLANSAWPVALSHLIESVGEHQRGRVSALMNISFELSLAATTLPAGLVMERVSYRLPYAFAAVALLIGALGYSYAFRGAARAAAAAEA